MVLIGLGFFVVLLALASCGATPTASASELSLPDTAMTVQPASTPVPPVVYVLTIGEPGYQVKVQTPKGEVLIEVPEGYDVEYPLGQSSIFEVGCSVILKEVILLPAKDRFERDVSKKWMSHNKTFFKWGECPTR